MTTTTEYFQPDSVEFPNVGQKHQANFPNGPMGSEKKTILS